MECALLNRIVRMRNGMIGARRHRRHRRDNVGALEALLKNSSVEEVAHGDAAYASKSKFKGVAKEDKSMSADAVESPIFQTKLKSRDLVAERTMAFHFEKPASFVFTPGQFIDVGLLSPSETDAEGNTRCFPVSSAPYEDTITVTTSPGHTEWSKACIPCFSRWHR